MSNFCILCSTHHTRQCVPSACVCVCVCVFLSLGTVYRVLYLYMTDE